MEKLNFRWDDLKDTEEYWLKRALRLTQLGYSVHTKLENLHVTFYTSPTYAHIHQHSTICTQAHFCGVYAHDTVRNVFKNVVAVFVMLTLIYLIVFSTSSTNTAQRAFAPQASRSLFILLFLLAFKQTFCLWLVLCEMLCFVCNWLILVKKWNYLHWMTNTSIVILK